MSAAPDLGAVFDEHVASEFDQKNVEATMRTMVTSSATSSKERGHGWR